MRRPVLSGWAEEQTPTPFLYDKQDLKQYNNCRLWGVCWHKIMNVMTLVLRPIEDNNVSEIKKKPYVTDCFEAMKSIKTDMDCIFYQLKDTNNDIIEGNIPTIYERNYIISLVTKLCKCGFNLAGYINGEVAKSLSLDEETGNEKVKQKYVKIRKMIKHDYTGCPSYVFPDLIIHDSHNTDKNNIIHKKQHIAIEAKTNGIGEIGLFYLDFFKLNYYLKALKFENVIYLIVGTTKTKIKEYLEQYSSEINYYSEDNLNNLYIFLQETINDDPKIYGIQLK